LPRRSHPGSELLELLIAGTSGRDHDSLLIEPGRARRHARRGRSADVGVVGAAGGEADQLAGEDGRDQRDVREVGAAPVGVVEDPGVARPLLPVEDGGDRLRHRAEVDGDVLCLHHHLAPGVEERRRAVASLLDVGRIRGVDQGGAHLLAGRAQAADHDLEGDRVDDHALAPRH
jgi:hypothetical protein